MVPMVGDGDPSFPVNPCITFKIRYLFFYWMHTQNGNILKMKPLAPENKTNGAQNNHIHIK